MNASAAARCTAALAALLISGCGGGSTTTTVTEQVQVQPPDRLSSAEETLVRIASSLSLDVCDPFESNANEYNANARIGFQLDAKEASRGVADLAEEKPEAPYEDVLFEVGKLPLREYIRVLGTAYRGCGPAGNFIADRLARVGQGLAP